MRSCCWCTCATPRATARSTWVPEFDKDIATKRVDNFASGFLDIGARAVFAYGMDQKIDFPRALMRGDRTMDDIFEAPNTRRHV